jgi:chromosome segregation ATPase
MNVVGKIFTVLVFIICISLASFALMVEAAHKVWRENVIAKGGLAEQLTEANKEKATLVEQKKDLEKRLVDEKDRYVRRLAALEQFSSDLAKEREGNDKSLAEKQDKLDELVRAIQSIHSALDTLHAQVVKMHADTKTAVVERREAFSKLLAVNDDLLNAVTERLRLAKLGSELNSQLAKMRTPSNAQVMKLDPRGQKPN